MNQYGECFICGSRGDYQRWFTRHNPLTLKRISSSGMYILLCPDCQSASATEYLRRFRFPDKVTKEWLKMEFPKNYGSWTNLPESAIVECSNCIFNRGVITTGLNPCPSPGTPCGYYIPCKIGSKCKDHYSISEEKTKRFNEGRCNYECSSCGGDLIVCSGCGAVFCGTHYKTHVKKNVWNPYYTIMLDNRGHHWWHWLGIPSPI